ncbi:hypothetical protein BKA62DRAFT_642187 [Auriculariales sp. MPI-PUGE-AT-0066]|nr:hypothetical protein BKA62DRAFT_642187 [Auriculariales sp. MPI-PUGE-AT-0066]
MSLNGTAPMAVPGLAVILPPGMSAHLTVGGIVVSTWSSVAAYGVVIATGVIYLLNFSDDRRLFRWLVAGCLLLATVDTVASLVWSYEWLVTLWGSIPGTVRIPYAFYVNMLCCSLATTVTQTFYCWRILLISDRNWALVFAIFACTISQQIVVIWALCKWGVNRAMMADIGIVLPGGYGWLISGILGDLIISGSLIYYLRRRMREEHSSVPALSKFHAWVSHIVQLNLFGLLSQTLMLIMFKLDVGTYFFLNDVILCKVYVFSLFVTLNARGSHTLFAIQGRTRSIPSKPFDVAPSSNNGLMIPLNTIPTTDQRAATSEFILSYPNIATDFSLAFTSRGSPLGTFKSSIVEPGTQVEERDRYIDSRAPGRKGPHMEIHISHEVERARSRGLDTDDDSDSSGTLDSPEKFKSKDLTHSI